QPCPNCNKAKQREKYDTMVAERQEFMAWIKTRHEKLQVELSYLKTKHFIIAWNIQRLPCDRKTKVKYGLPPNPPSLSLHEALHIYAMRAEDYFDVHQEVFNLGEDDELDKVQVFWARNRRERETIQTNHEYYENIYGVMAQYWTGTKGDSATWAERRPDWGSDDNLKYTHAHLVALAIHDKWQRQCPPRPREVWLQHGYAHWMEYKFYRDSRIYCHHETQPQVQSWGHYHWRFKIYKKVAAGEIVTFSDIINRSGDTWGYDEHGFVFAFVDFLIHYDKEKWLEFQKTIRQTFKYAPTVEKVYGWSPMMFDEVFKDWVLAYYPRSKGEDNNWVYDPDNPRGKDGRKK
ncbi:hypothetical protein ACFL54_07790, partial [Planctomycetota bacterium]